MTIISGTASAFSLSPKTMSIHPKTPFRDRLFTQIDGYLKTLDWNENACREYLSDNFNARTSRHQLNDDELRDLDHKLDWLSNHLSHKTKTHDPN
jgi:hypothetical protein